jgi:multidrug efflux pump subunit AcrB
MKVSFFIDRPVFSAVISILIVIVGIIGLMMLPIDQYPQITPPVVKISASYPGASAVTVSQAVATPIEQELNGTPGMLYMESSSSNSGGFSATVTFDISADPDLAAVEIQNRIKLAESRLPAEVIQNGISVEKQAPSQLMTLCLTSDDPKFDEIYLSNFATLNVQDLLRRIPGVGRISNIGSRYYAMQIWADPAKLANFGLTVQDLQNALKDQNRESAAGVLGQQPVSGVDITVPITAQGRLSSASQFEEIVLRANPDGSLVRLRDVARVSLEASSYSTESGINGGNAAILGIYMLPGANAMEVAQNVKEAMKEISKSFPEGMEYNFPFDMTTYISQSIHEVYKTLFEALVLVIIVVFLSLQSWRATLIPVVAVPISLIGTFGFMLIFGFSLNMLTLLGLVLAIGIVVDDAIVVVENVEHALSDIPGAFTEFSQPIQMRFNELMTGVRSDVAVKIFGEDIDMLVSKGEEVVQLINGIEGVSDVKAERVAGLPQITIRYNKDKLALYGLKIGDLNKVVRMGFAGETAGVVYEGEKRFDLVVRLDNDSRKDIENLKALFVTLPSGNQIPLEQIADVKYEDGPMQISRENGKRRIVVGFNVRGADVKTVVETIQAKLDEKLKLPEGYYTTYGGQFENLIEANKRLSVAVPVALGLILVLLYFTFKSIKQSLLIFTAIPLSAIGGIIALWLRDMPFSISAGVGFIALFGVAVLNGIVLIGYFNELKKQGMDYGIIM